MEIDDYDIGFFGNFGDYSVGRLERTIDIPHKNATLEVDYGDFSSIIQFVNIIPVTRRLGRVIRGAQQPGFVLEIGIYLFLIPYMVSAGLATDAQAENRFRYISCQTKSAGSVLHISDNKVISHTAAFAFFQIFLKAGSPRFSIDISYE